MAKLLRRWFGLRCGVKCCPSKWDREHGMLVCRCTDCGDVRFIVN